MFNYKKNSNWADNIAIVTQLGLTMAGCIIFCFFIGFYLDKWLGTRGIFVAIFTILGVIGGGNVCYREILKITQSSNGAASTDSRFKDTEIKDKNDETSK